MSIKDELDAELKDALRAKDRRRLDAIRQITTQATNAMTEPGFDGPADDEFYRNIIAAYTKKMDKARAEYEEFGDRGAAMAEKLAFEIEYLGRWLPEAPSADDLRPIVEAAIAELGVDDPGQSGRVVGHIMKNNPGIDGRTVNDLVRQTLEASSPA